MIKSNEIRQIARNKLSGNWPKAFAITAIYIIINIALSYCIAWIKNVTINTPILAYSAEIIFSLLLLPLSFGLISAIIKLINGKNPEYTTLINDAILNASKSIGIFFRTLLKMLIPSLLVILAFAGIIFLVNKALPFSWDTLGGYIILIAFLYFLAIILIAILALPYVLSSYALANNTKLTSKEALDQSIALMDTNKWNFAKLILSFFGWFILIGLTIGLIKSYTPSVFGELAQAFGTVLLLPYIIASISVFYDEVNDVSVEVVDTKKEEENIEK